MNEADFEWVRARVGSEPTDIELLTIHDRVGNRAAVVREVLVRRLADLLAAPSSFNVSGEYAQNTAANISALQAQLGDPELSGGVRVVPPPSARSR